MLKSCCLWLIEIRRSSAGLVEGSQAVAWMWAAIKLTSLCICAGPAQFQNPNCTGNTLTGTIACAPTDASMYAWNDFLAFLTSRWGGGVKGRFTHFIIWNEVR